MDDLLALEDPLRKVVGGFKEQGLLLLDVNQHVGGLGVVLVGDDNILEVLIVLNVLVLATEVVGEDFG